MRSVLVTGAARGIGAAIAARYRADGWRVVAPSRTELDLADAAAVARFCERADVGHIDVLVNNAGAAATGPIAMQSDEQLRAQFGTHVVGPLALTREALPTLRRDPSTGEWRVM